MKSRTSKRPAPSTPSKRPRPAQAENPSKKPVRWADNDEEGWHDDWEDDGAPAADEEPLYDDEPEVPDPLEAESAEEEEEEDEDERPAPAEDEDAPAQRTVMRGEDEDDDEEGEGKRRGRRRSKTIARKQMLRERRKMIAQGSIPEVVDYTRPRMRSECRHGERPCLYVSCRYHLFLDVNPMTGSIKLNFPDKEVWELEETCALDVAERGGITLEEVGEIMNLTRERIRQVEVSGLEKLKAGDASLETFVDGRELPALTQIPGND